MAQCALTAAGDGEAVVPASELRAAHQQIRELQRLLGKKTLEPDSFRRLFPEVPEGTPGTGTMVRASRWTPWRCDAVLEIGCPAPHPTASCDDLSIDHGQKHDPRLPGMPAQT